MYRTEISNQTSKRSGFTLVELVVVVLILGIIAAVAAPKMFNVAGDARRNTTLESLNVVRDAIELYNSQNGAYPGPDEAGFKLALKNHLRGPFPMCHVASTANNDVFISIVDPVVLGGGSEGWAYNPATGEIIINVATFETY